MTRSKATASLVLGRIFGCLCSILGSQNPELRTKLRPASLSSITVGTVIFMVASANATDSPRCDFACEVVRVENSYIHEIDALLPVGQQSGLVVPLVTAGCQKVTVLPLP